MKNEQHDELENDEVVVVDDKKKAKPVKQPRPPTSVISARLEDDKIKALEGMDIDVPALFKHFVEHEVLQGKVCPTCGQTLKKGKKA